MKKITLQIFSFLCLISTLSFGQTYTSGLFNIIPNYDAQIDINVTTNIVTLTLIGPDSGWLAIGFDSFGHDNKDVVMFDGSNLQDRQFTGSFNEPNSDPLGAHDWTVTSNIANAGVRTVVATRARVSSDTGDYDFSATPSTLNVVGGYNNSFDTGNRHDERGFATANFSLLGFDDYNKIQFTMAPNPATSYLKVVLPSSLRNASVEIFDMLARNVYNRNMINSHFSLIDVSAWASGVYLVRVSNGASSQTKRFVKQ